MPVILDRPCPPNWPFCARHLGSEIPDRRPCSWSRERGLRPSAWSLAIGWRWCWPQRFRGGARLVTDRVVPIFGCACREPCPRHATRRYSLIMPLMRACLRTWYRSRSTGSVAVSAARRSSGSGAAGADCGGSRTRAGSAADGLDSRSRCGPGARVGILRKPSRKAGPPAARSVVLAPLPPEYGSTFGAGNWLLMNAGRLVPHWFQCRGVRPPVVAQILWIGFGGGHHSPCHTE